VLGRDQVALLEVYVLAGFVLAHWCGERLAPRLRASVDAADRRRHRGRVDHRVTCAAHRIACARFEPARVHLRRSGRGSLHWTHLLSLAFPDLFGAMNPKVDFWGAGGWAWNERFGLADLFLAQNMGLLYSGALAAVTLAIGISRGALWSREIRFFTVAALITAFFMSGLVHAGVPRDVRADAGREAVPPPCRCDLRVRRADRHHGRLRGASLADRSAAQAASAAHRIRMASRSSRHALARRYDRRPTLALKPIMTGSCFALAAHRPARRARRSRARRDWCCSALHHRRSRLQQRAA
jgi:hypothetical protein